MISRGLAALILTLFFSSTLFAEYLYKDEVIFDSNVSDVVDTIGNELFEKTGIKLYVAVIKELEQNQTIVDYEKSLAGELKEPFVLLTISEYDKQIDILARPTALYKDFDKEQILSPFPNSGTILPFLSWKVKDATTSERYGAAVENGYMDIAGQIAESKGLKLDSVPADTNKTIFAILRLFFYGMIAYAIVLWIRRKYLTRKMENE